MERDDKIEKLQKESRWRHYIIDVTEKKSIPVPAVTIEKRKPGRPKKPVPVRRVPDEWLRIKLRNLYNQGILRDEKLKRENMEQAIKKMSHSGAKKGVQVDHGKLKEFMSKRIISPEPDRYFEEDKPKQITRHKAEYTNSKSPYGIWDEIRTTG